FHLEEGTVRNVVGDQHPTLFLVEDPDFTGAAHHHLHFIIVLVSRFDRPDSFKLNNTGELGLDIGFYRNVGSSTTDVERTERQLGTRLADGLCGNYADGLADLNHFSGRQISSVTLRTSTHFRFAGQNGTNLHFLDAGLFNALSNLV